MIYQVKLGDEWVTVRPVKEFTRRDESYLEYLLPDGIPRVTKNFKKTRQEV